MALSAAQRGVKAKDSHKANGAKPRKGMSPGYPDWVCVNCKAPLQEASTITKCKCGGYYVRWVNFEVKR